MIGAVALDGMRALMTVEGGTSAAVFRRFLDEHLTPALRPGDVVVMDNLGAPHATGMAAAIEAVGARALHAAVLARLQFYVSSACEMRLEALSTRMLPGLPHLTTSSATTATTRLPVSDVSSSITRYSRVDRQNSSVWHARRSL
jgi:hypothetical protein